MNAPVDAPRLYSRQRTLPVDVIAEQHRELHAWLEQWGAWNASRYRPASCNSVESCYREQTAKATGDGIDPRIMVMERAVLGVPMLYRTTVRFFYVERMSPGEICRRQVIRKSGFQAWMFLSRCMVVNRLRFNGDLTAA